METLNLIKNDPWLEPFEDAIKGRHQHVLDKEAELTNKGKQTLSDFASGYLYFGLHRTADGWIFREWAPNATEIFIVGTFNEWKELKKYSLKRKDYGVWEIKLPADAMRHGDLYKLIVHWEGGCGERIPAWATRVVQDEQTKIFSAQVWSPEKPYKVKKRTFKPNTDPLLIYECHIGMAQQEDKVGTYNEFREKTLPRIAKAGYNCIQIMAIQEHPYYGSFGYHVSSFFAASSRFGTPEELKELIDTAHGLGIAVIMDIVHSHAVKNEVEGLGNFAGDPNQYFYPGARREHPAWDSLCFDYGKNEVIHFLLSNCKYWLEERAMTRTLPCRSGNILLDDRSIASYGRKEFARTAAFMPQSRPVPGITVRALVAHGRFPYLGFSRRMTAQDTAAVEQAMRRTGTLDWAYRDVRALSGGERQRVYLAMALAQGGTTILLDEPGAFLDVRAQFELLDLLRSVAAGGKAVVLVMHELPQAMQYADRIALLGGGRLLGCDTSAALAATGAVDRVFGVRLCRAPDGVWYVKAEG